MEKPLKAVVLAAGRGTRLRTEGSDIPKVMRTAAGRPLLSYVLQALSFIPPRDTVIVVGYRKERIVDAFPGYCFAEQTEQLGTGHAVMSAFAVLSGYHGDLLICCGDMPLIRRETYWELWESHKSAGGAARSSAAHPISPTGTAASCGRRRRICCHREEKGLYKLQLAQRRSSTAAFISSDARRPQSRYWDGWRRSNAQGRKYSTDAPGLLLATGGACIICSAASGREMIGVNTPEPAGGRRKMLSERAESSLLDVDEEGYRLASLERQGFRELNSRSPVI